MLRRHIAIANILYKIEKILSIRLSPLGVIFMKVIDKILRVAVVLYLLMYILIAPLCIYVIISSIDIITVMSFIILTFGVLGIIHMIVTEKRKVDDLGEVNK